MSYVKIQRQPIPFVTVPYWFIIDYMPKGSSGDIKVYFYLLALMNSSDNESISLEEVAKKLDMLHSEVVSALTYWHKQGVVCFETVQNDAYTLEFLTNPPAHKPSLPLAKTIISQTRPEYQTAELHLYMQENAEIKRLFLIAEQYLGRLLTVTDQKILFGLYDWLHLPLDVIEYLVEYCASHHHTAIRYIEKVAISWVDEGITTIEKAREKVTIDKKYFTILAALGASKEKITNVEKACMDGWLSKYQFSLEIILEACKRTVLQTSKPSLNYTESILSSWYKQNVHSLDDIMALDKARTAKAKLSPSSNMSKKPIKATKFTNICSHDWDFDELEKLENDYVTRRLQGGASCAE